MDRFSDEKSLTGSTTTETSEWHPTDDSNGHGHADSITSGARGSRLENVFSILHPRSILSWLCGINPPSSSPEILQTSQRRRYIDTGSQAFSADVDLLDLLSIRSQSGSINVNVHPQPADEKNPVPAELNISSRSGSIDVKMPGFNVPEREYVVSVDSRSGSVDGDLIHGQRTSVSSHSGSLSLRLMMLKNGGKSASLSTSGRSGQSDVTLVGPARPGEAIDGMSSEHTTASGSMKLRYPREWQGTIEGHSGSGSVRIHGPGVEIIRNGPHEIFAKKGDGNNRLTFRTGSGSVDVSFE